MYHNCKRIFEHCWAGTSCQCSTGSSTVQHISLVLRTALLQARSRSLDNCTGAAHITMPAWGQHACMKSRVLRFDSILQRVWGRVIRSRIRVQHNSRKLSTRLRATVNCCQPYSRREVQLKGFCGWFWLNWPRLNKWHLSTFGDFSTLSFTKWPSRTVQHEELIQRLSIFSASSRWHSYIRRAFK